MHGVLVVVYDGGHVEGGEGNEVGRMSEYDVTSESVVHDVPRRVQHLRMGRTLIVRVYNIKCLMGFLGSL